MSLEANKALVARFFEEVWNRGDLAVVDELVDPEFVNFGVRRGTAGMTRIVTETHVLRIAGGRIAEHWASRNDLAMLQQLGIIAPPDGR